jgi:hypothetical protein
MTPESLISNVATRVQEIQEFLKNDPAYPIVDLSAVLILSSYLLQQQSENISQTIKADMFLTNDDKQYVLDLYRKTNHLVIDIKIYFDNLINK